MTVRLEPLGDQGVLARFADETEALRWAEAVRRLGPDWLLDVVQAYATVAVFHDPARLSPRQLSDRLRGIDPAGVAPAGRLHLIPCCYERRPDLARIAGHVGLSP